MTHPARALTLFALASACVTAWAGRPLVTEDAGVLEPGNCEVEAYAAQQRTRSATESSGGSVQFGCGILGHSQVALASSREKADGEVSRRVTLAGKTALLAPAAEGTAFTLAWGLAAVREPGRSYAHEDTFLTGVASKALPHGWSVHANLGWSKSQSLRRQATGWALAVEHETSERLGLMAETFGSDRERAPWVQIAARWTLVPQLLSVDASWGVQTSSERPQQFTIGFKAAF